MSGQIVERGEKWEPIEGIVTPVARAVINEDHSGLVVTLIFSEMVNGLKSDLRIEFGRIPAYAVHEEFVHPWDFENTARFSGEWDRYVFPMYRITDSEWMRSLATRLNCLQGAFVHYRLLTLDQNVDVISYRMANVKWVDPTHS